MEEIVVPTHWVKTNLDNVLLAIVGGGTPSKANLSYYQGSIPWMSVKDMNKHVLEDTVDHISQEAVDSSSTNVIPAGVPIIATRMSLGKIVVAHFDTAINQDLKALFLSQQIDRNYLIWWYRSIAREIERLGTGTTVKGIRLEVLRDLQFPLSPLAEQKIIAEKLDTLLAQVESIKARLERIPEILKQFRQSVLAAAVSGKLTEEWRRVEGVSFETWKYEAAKDVCEKVQSGSTPRENPFDQDGTIPFLKVYNIVNQKIDFDYKPQFITSGTHLGGSSARSIALPNDVLMNIVGPPLGKVAILTSQFPEWNLNQAITLFRVNQERLDHKYLYYVLCEGALVRNVMPETKGSVGQINISLSQCREAILAVPSITEQREIVRYITKLFMKADAIDKHVQSALERVNNLTQSILAKAFCGELTAEWREANPELMSGENSAEALLEKIKVERISAKRGRGKA